ncbi:DUF6338 family protein [Actinoallomurus sp. NPDC052274]|uniref:DUF6338 family protein n=1 Tax=Actinoallomurus sp. NPDC052274 TaxID=3155420 RepID=UPI0034272B93
MAPPATFGALIIVLALVPGWSYLRLVERFSPARSANALHQLLEVFAVGMATTGVSVLLLLLVPHGWLPFTLRADAWAAGGNQYLGRHIRSAAASIAMLLASALLIAYGLFRFRTRGKPEGFRPSGDVWLHGLSDQPAGKVPYVGLHLVDGRLVEGKLYAFTFDVEKGRGLVVAKPIRVTQANETLAQDLPNLDRLIVDASQISFVTVVYVPGMPAS